MWDPLCGLLHLEHYKQMCKALSLWIWHTSLEGMSFPSTHQRWFFLNALEKVVCSLTGNIPLQHWWLQPEACWQILVFFPGLMSQQELRAPRGDDLTPPVPTAPKSPGERGGCAEWGLSGVLLWCTTATHPGLHALTVMRPLAGNKGSGVITYPLHKHVKLRTIICGIWHRRECLISV